MNYQDSTNLSEFTGTDGPVRQPDIVWRHRRNILFGGALAAFLCWWRAGDIPTTLNVQHAAFFGMAVTWTSIGAGYLCDIVEGAFAAARRSHFSKT